VKISADELAQALEEKRAEMTRLAYGLLRRSGLSGDAEDVVQDAMMKILSMTDYDFTDGVGGVFASSVMGLVINLVKIHTRRVELVSDDYTRIYQPDSQAHMRQRERLKIDVEEALALLEPQTSQIVRLTWMEDMTYLNIQAELTVAPNTIADALASAKPVLQIALARYDHRQRPANVPAEERVSASQPPYKEGIDETSDSTALQAAMDGDGASETSPVSWSITKEDLIAA
jgi:RNA polymerase sigma factor (sigma-70 family)